MSSFVKSLFNKLGFKKTNNQALTELSANEAPIKPKVFDIEFTTPKINPNSIWWQNAPKIHALAHLQRGSLSGPIQEIKTNVRDMLIKLFVVEKISQKVALKNITGLCGNIVGDAECSSMETLAVSEHCKKIHIISNLDFQKKLDRIIPKNHIELVSAEWLNPHYFWQSKKNNLDFACVVAYARKRQIALELDANIKHYYVSRRGLAALQTNYFVLAMNDAAWRNPKLMSILFEQELPYVRLPLLFDALILPKKDSSSYKLGRDLLASNAIDIITLLKNLVNK